MNQEHKNFVLTPADRDPPAKFRFGIRQLLYITALVASGLVLGAGTLITTFLVITVWAIVLAQRDRRRALSMLLLAVCLFIGLGSCLMLPTVEQVRGVARRSQCMNNMRQIMLGILNYESAFGHLPTDRLVTTQDGKLLHHSWRVLILPFIEGNSVYQQYDFNEPWDGPNNRKLASASSYSCFYCPSHDTEPKTPYKLVVGPGTAFDIDHPRSIADVTDGDKFTIALIEDTVNPVHWMEPADLSPEQATELLNRNDRKRCSHFHETPFERCFVCSNIALLDGSTDAWPAIPDQIIQPGHFLIADGILFDFKSGGRSIVEIKFGGYVALGIYLFLIVLPICWVLKKNASCD